MEDITAEKAFELASVLDKGIGGELCAAIALTLDRCTQDEVHDEESYKVTIKPTFSAWASRQATVRALPERKK